MIIEGILLGYLPYDGAVEIDTDGFVEFFNMDNEMRSKMRENPSCYVHLINCLVLAHVKHGTLVELQPAPKP